MGSEQCPEAIGTDGAEKLYIGTESGRCDSLVSPFSPGDFSKAMGCKSLTKRRQLGSSNDEIDIDRTTDEKFIGRRVHDFAGGVEGTRSK
jgi:hypothetical protein